MPRSRLCSLCCAHSNINTHIGEPLKLLDASSGILPNIKTILEAVGRNDPPNPVHEVRTYTRILKRILSTTSRSEMLHTFRSESWWRIHRVTIVWLTYRCVAWMQNYFTMGVKYFLILNPWMVTLSIRLRAGFFAENRLQKIWRILRHRHSGNLPHLGIRAFFSACSKNCSKGQIVKGISSLEPLFRHFSTNSMATLFFSEFKK